MSYILDALKKVEHEKLKKSAPGGMTSIAGDLFQDRIQPSAGGGRWKIIILIVMVSLMTFAGTWLLLRANKPKNALHSSPATSSTAVPATPPPSAPVAATAPVQTVTVSPAMPTASDADDEERPAKIAKRPLKQPAAMVATPQLKPSLQSVQPPADIKLSGIAWQDERSARRAVVNGFLLKEGNVVSGARVTEIMADRVRFALPSGTFEVRLDAVPAAEVRR